MVTRMSTRRTFLQQAFWAGLGLCASAQPLAALAATSASVHIVRSGDTLGEIALTYDVSVAALRQHNRLRSDHITVGQKLKIPPRSENFLAPVISATHKLQFDPARWRHIVIHHSGIEDGNASAYHQGHLRRGMEHGLAYHFVIGNGRDSGDGQIEVGPRWLKQLHGGHVRQQAVNEHGIGICLVGNFEKRRPSARQFQAFTDLVDYLRQGRVARTCKLTVHRWVDRNHTICPGRYFPYVELRRRYPT